MKPITILIVCFLLLFQAASFAQGYNPFRFGMGGGLVMPQNWLPGISIYVEPSLRFSDQFTLGFKIESIAKPNADIAVMGSYTLNGQYYYFTKGLIRPFVGLGFGMYTPNRGPLISCTCEDEPKNTNVFGFYPRVGFDFNRLVVSMDYNVVQTVKKKIYYDDPVMNPGYPEYFDAKTSYLSLKVGFFVWGSKKKEAVPK